MIARNILQRTFHIKYQVDSEAVFSTLGTAFTFEREGKQYLATASHSFPFTEHEQTLDFLVMFKNNWICINSKIYKHPNKHVDIVALALPKDISPRLEIKMIGKGLIIGQDCFFLGFPYGKFMEAKDANNGYPLPFAKKGICSSIIRDDDNVVRFYLDGMNNPGFSGGPGIFVPSGEESPAIFGVVKGYLPHEVEVKTPFGQYSFEENSGIVEVHSIAHLDEINIE